MLVKMQWWVLILWLPGDVNHIRGVDCILQMSSAWCVSCVTGSWCSAFNFHEVVVQKVGRSSAPPKLRQFLAVVFWMWNASFKSSSFAFPRLSKHCCLIPVDGVLFSRHPSILSFWPLLTWSSWLYYSCMESGMWPWIAFPMVRYPQPWSELNKEYD